MISKMTDEDALDMLMTSDFIDNYSPSEYKEMLIRYRYFYRLLFSKMQRVKEDGEYEIMVLSDKLNKVEEKVTNLQLEGIQKDGIINNLKHRKLTLKERFLGKIILDDNEV